MFETIKATNWAFCLITLTVFNLDPSFLWYTQWVRKPKTYTSIDSATRPMSSSVHGMGLQAQVRYFTKWVLTNPKPPPPHHKFEACKFFLIKGIFGRL